MLTYLLPLILATFLIGWLRRGLRHPATPFVALLVTFVGGGLSETYLIPQNVGLTLAFGGALLFAPSAARRALAPHLAAALIGGIAALALIVIAPATALRVGGPPADLRLASLASVATAGVQVLRLGRYFPFAIVLCLLLPALVGVRANACDRRWFWLVTACVTITLPFCYFPSFYAQNGNPPARSLIVPGTIIVAYLLFVGYTFGGLVGGLTAKRRTTVLYAASVIPIGVALVTLPEVASAAYHAALWDAEDAQIRSTRDSGLADVVVAGLPSYMGENFVTSNPSDWLNGCVSRYYGIRSIAALPPQ